MGNMVEDMGNMDKDIDTRTRSWKHGPGDIETLRMELWRLGNMEKWSHGDMKIWRQGDRESLRHADVNT